MCFDLCRLWDEDEKWMHSPELQQMTCRRIKMEEEESQSVGRLWQMLAVLRTPAVDVSANLQMPRERRALCHCHWTKNLSRS